MNLVVDLQIMTVEDFKTNFYFMVAITKTCISLKSWTVGRWMQRSQPELWWKVRHVIVHKVSAQPIKVKTSNKRLLTTFTFSPACMPQPRKLFKQRSSPYISNPAAQQIYTISCFNLGTKRSKSRLISDQVDKGQYFIIYSRGMVLNNGGIETLCHTLKLPWPFQ